VAGAFVGATLSGRAASGRLCGVTIAGRLRATGIMPPKSAVTAPAFVGDLAPAVSSDAFSRAPTSAAIEPNRWLGSGLIARTSTRRIAGGDFAPKSRHASAASAS
jgi:hypothetical protein